MTRHRGQNATGGSRARATNPRPEGRPAAYDAPPSVLALLRGCWAKREHLTNRERGAVQDFLRRAQEGPLSGKQLDYAKAIGRTVGVGFDDPPVHEIAPARPVAQPWGPLPLKPPGRAT